MGVIGFNCSNCNNCGFGNGIPEHKSEMKNIIDEEIDIRDSPTMRTKAVNTQNSLSKMNDNFELDELDVCNNCIQYILNLIILGN